MYLNKWNNLDEMKADFWPRYCSEYAGELDGANVLLASYGTPQYEGYAFVLFERDGKLYEVNGSHCSCYGLEGQWQPEETTVEALRHRLEQGNLGAQEYDGNPFAAELRAVLDSLNSNAPGNQHAEDLRAQFEKSISDAATFKVVREGDGYTDRACGWAWEGYQAGHAAGVAAERERCVQVCDRVALAWAGEEAPDGGYVAKQCSDALRTALATAATAAVPAIPDAITHTIRRALVKFSDSELERLRTLREPEKAAVATFGMARIAAQQNIDDAEDALDWLAARAQQEHKQ